MNPRMVVAVLVAAGCVLVSVGIGMLVNVGMALVVGGALTIAYALVMVDVPDRAARPPGPSTDGSVPPRVARAAASGATARRPERG
jgi:hypothetical protein